MPLTGLRKALSTSVGAAALSVVSNTTLIVLKTIVGIITGSVSVLAEAIHSGADLAASFIAFFSLRVAYKPADEGHPFGHGKAENVSGTIEAILIFVAAGLIIYQAGRKIIGGVPHLTVDLGIGVMAFSMVANILISRYLFHVAKKNDSLALEADAYHLSTDAWTSAGVMVGLGVVRITHINLLDPLVALGVAVLIIKAAWDIMHRSFVGLVDVSLSQEEQILIISCFEDHAHDMLGFHHLRTRRAGRERFIDLHLVLCRQASVNEAHSLCDHLEEDIQGKLRWTDVTIHTEPCELVSDYCATACPLQKKE